MVVHWPQLSVCIELVVCCSVPKPFPGIILHKDPPEPAIAPPRQGIESIGTSSKPNLASSIGLPFGLVLIFLIAILGAHQLFAELFLFGAPGSRFERASRAEGRRNVVDQYHPPIVIPPTSNRSSRSLNISTASPEQAGTVLFRCITDLLRTLRRLFAHLVTFARAFSFELFDRRHKSAAPLENGGLDRGYGRFLPSDSISRFLSYLLLAASRLLRREKRRSPWRSQFPEYSCPRNPCSLASARARSRIFWPLRGTRLGWKNRPVAALTVVTLAP